MLIFPHSFAFATHQMGRITVYEVMIGPAGGTGGGCVTRSCSDRGNITGRVFGETVCSSQVCDKIIASFTKTQQVINELHRRRETSVGQHFKVCC